MRTASGPQGSFSTENRLRLDAQIKQSKVCGALLQPAGKVALE